jgi:general stress protein 26
MHYRQAVVTHIISMWRNYMSSNDQVTISSQEENAKRVLTFLESQNTGVLCTNGIDGRPYGSVVYFSAHQDSVVTFTTKEHTMKSQNIDKDADVMLVVFDAEQQATLQLSGRAQEIDDTLKATEILHETMDDSLETSGRTIPPVAKLEAGDFVAYKIVPTDIKMAVFNSAEFRSYDEQFITLTAEDLKNL